jgi:hypothetical protein
MLRVLPAILVALSVCPAVAQPLADHHQHLFSPALAALISPAPPAEPVAPSTAVSDVRNDGRTVKRIERKIEFVSASGRVPCCRDRYTCG